jgi:hypothetical protein
MVLFSSGDPVKQIGRESFKFTLLQFSIHGEMRVVKVHTPQWSKAHQLADLENNSAPCANRIRPIALLVR